MKPGSIVVVKKLILHPSIAKNVKWLPIDDESTPYMIREMPVEKSASLEEGIIGYDEDGKELLINIKYLIEITPSITVAK